MAYTVAYDNPGIRGTSVNPAWDVVEVVRSLAKPSDVLIDVGCGTARKLVRLAPYVSHIYGVDPDARMIDAAERKIASLGIQNITLGIARHAALPFPEQWADLVACMLARIDVAEAYRVLKYDGHVVFEHTGEKAKLNIVGEFRDDKWGKRNRYNREIGQVMAHIYRRKFGSLFKEVEVREAVWDMYYSYEGLVGLLEQTPTVLRFDMAGKEDREALERIVAKYTTDKGIWTQEHRILVVAKK